MAASAPRDIVILPGDGIGASVCRETIRVLDAVGFKVSTHTPRGKVVFFF
jgi:isocitrate/isopropylmalate dehydrogenase